MSFQNKKDYCGLGSISGLELKSASLGASAQFLEKSAANGSIVATEFFGQVVAPSNEYAVSADVTLSSIKLGAGIKPDDSGTLQLARASVSISTTAGDMPTVSATAQQIEALATAASTPTGTVCKYTLPSITLACAAHAQDFGAFEITGANCELQSCNLEASANIVTTQVNGVPMASDAAAGKLVVSATIGQYGSAVPTVAAKSGWVQSAALDCSDPDSDFPTWTVSFEKVLSVDVVQQ